MSQLKSLCYVAIGVLLFASCVPEPNYPNEPSISFVSIENKSFPDQFIDSVYIVIRIEDGDGDLGLSKEQVDPPYSPTIIENGVEVPNKFAFNYFIEVKKKVNDAFEEVPFLDGATFDGRYPVLQDGTGALEVNLIYGFELFVGVAGSPIENGDEVAFDVQIADRALNLSNQITTESVIIGQGGN